MSTPSEQRIVVGVDGSGASKEALRTGVRLARALGAPLEAITFLGGPTTLPVDPLAGGAGPREDHRRMLRGLVTAVCGEDVPEDLTTTVLGGRPAEQLITESAHAQLLVLGRHGLSGVPGSLGSVTHACVAYARCPVLVVRH